MKVILKFLMAFACVLSSCSTPKDICYFQDNDYKNAQEVAVMNEITVKPGDKVSIVVNSKDPLLAEMFNLSMVSHRPGSAVGLSNTQQISCYTVTKDGEIDFPVLGKVNIMGLTREQIAKTIKTKLIENQYVNDPVVTVEFGNLYFSVLGEVARPGRYNIEHDRVTILDAISMAGDLTIYGKRQSVKVLREENGKQKAYMVDLTSSKNLYASPVFYLQQKDVVYVDPNDNRARQSTVNGNTVRSTQFWISLSTLGTSVALLVQRKR